MRSTFQFGPYYYAQYCLLYLGHFGLLASPTLLLTGLLVSPRFLYLLLGLPRRTPLSVPSVVLANGGIRVETSIVTERAMVAHRPKSLAYRVHRVLCLLVLSQAIGSARQA